jgi:hypothetical protein
MKKLIFDLTNIPPESLETELSELMDCGYTPQLEETLASYAGKIVKVTFTEVKGKNK